jgi:hypothetical protein
MKSFQEYTDDDFDEELYIEESAVRNLSAGVLFSRVLSKSKEIHRTKDVSKKLDLIASQNTHISALVFAMTQFTPKK